MDTGGLAQMSLNGFTSNSGLGLPSGGLASRRGGQAIKPLSIEALKSPTEPLDNAAPTPRTSRSHLLAGLRTAPKSATASTFPASPTSALPPSSNQSYGRNSIASNMYGAQEGMYNGPKTSLPHVPAHQQAYSQMLGVGQPQYTADQILAPPEIHIDEQVQEQLDPLTYAELVATNMYLARQQQQLQQQLSMVQAAAQQFNLGGQVYQQYHPQQHALQNLMNQQQHLKSLQQVMVSSMQPQQNLYTYYDPLTGQTWLVDQNQQSANSMNNVYMDQPATPQGYGFPQQSNNTPRVQVSPPAMESEKPFFRSNSPPKKTALTGEPVPLPPPSANAFRRGHKKSLSNVNKAMAALSTEDAPKSPGLKMGSSPLSPLPNGYGPGQARAGEHPVRQPRGPPSIDELRSKPTAKHEGSKNFAARTRRSAVHNLMRAGMERRKGTSSSSGSMSPVSETAEEVGTPLTDDNESDSGRSGSGSLSGDAEPSLASSRTSTRGSWGAIGSDRPSSRQKSRKSVDSLSSACDSEHGDHGSFASVFKHGTQRVSKPESPDGQRKAPMLVLTSAEKRKGGIAA